MADASAPPQHAPALLYKFENKTPVELADLAKSWTGLTDEFSRFNESQDSPVEGLRFFVKEIRPGSIEGEFLAYVPLIMPFVQHCNEVVSFIQYVKSGIEYFVGKVQGEKPKELQIRQSYENFLNLIEPVAKDNGSMLNLNLHNSPITVNLTINSLEANAAQNSIRRVLAEMSEVKSGIKEKVALYWYQARNDPKSTAGDRAIIESLYRGAVKTIFAHEGIKARMLYTNDNPFTHNYLVDVVVETARSKPVLYRIINFHQLLDKDDGAAPV